MYNNIKSNYSRFGSRNRSGGRGGSRGQRNNGINPNIYVNKSAIETVEEKIEIKHKFTDFAFNPMLIERINRRGYITPTPIQDQTIPLIMNGRDVIGIADTGTGKTAAFLLPILHKMLHNRNEKALIIVPTRELAVQIEDELRAFSPGLQIFSALCIGGTGFGNQVRALQRRPQFIIGTPGRLKDHMNRRTMHLNDVTNLVLDEADRMVEMGFIEDIRALISNLPTTRQSLFFSATVMPEVKNLVNSFLNNPVTVSVKKRDTSANVDQDVVRYTDSFSKLSLLHDILAHEESKKVLIFGRTKHGVEKLNEELQDRGFSAVSIHGNKSQPQRQRALDDFKQNRAQIMVATDVAARGLDIPNVTHVINYDVPENYADYIHRIGRTGRANNKGKALTFVR